MADLNRALEISPSSTKAITERAFVFALLGDTDAAFGAIEQLAKSDGGKVISILQNHWKTQGHYSGMIDGIIGPASQSALVACAKDPACPAPVALLKSEVVLEASALEPLNSSSDLKLYHRQNPPFSVLYPSSWSVQKGSSDVIFLSADRTARCGLRWFELDWISQRLTASTIADSYQDGSRRNFRRNQGYAPTDLGRREMFVNGFPTVEFIDDLKGGKSIKRYTVAGDKVYKFDCESYTAVFQSKLEAFKMLLNSLQPS